MTDEQKQEAEPPLAINSIADFIVNLDEIKDRLDRSLFGMTEAEFAEIYPQQ